MYLVCYTRVPKFRNAHPPSTASPFGRINLEPSQATASKHRSPHSVRVTVRVRVRVGWSASGATAKTPLHMYPVLYTWYQVLRYTSSITFIIGAFQTRTSGCAYNTTRQKRGVDFATCRDPLGVLVYHPRKLIGWTFRSTNISL